MVGCWKWQWRWMSMRCWLKHRNVDAMSMSAKNVMFVHYNAPGSSSRPTTQRTAVVGSRLDYCNSLLYGVSETNLNKLQRVQNSLAHIILGLDTQSSTMQNLADRLWLPVRTRINSKIAFFMFKTLASCHWATCLSVWTTSVPHNAMTPPFQRPSSAPWRRGQNRLWQLWFFCHTAASVWNLLPPQLTADFNSVFLSTFKHNLKTHFYWLSFILQSRGCSSMPAIHFYHATLCVARYLLS